MRLLLPALWLSTACLFVGSASAQDGSFVTIDAGSPALHFAYGNHPIWIEPAFEDYSFMLWDACDAMELSQEDCNILPMNGDLGGNALATVVDTNRMIIYDRELSPLIGYEGAMAIIAHELAHHYCGHLSEFPNIMQEVEADRFAGAALRKFGLDIDAARSMAEIFDDRTSRLHPGKEDRLEAISFGWDNPDAAKNCR